MSWNIDIRFVYKLSVHVCSPYGNGSYGDSYDFNERFEKGVFHTSSNMSNQWCQYTNDGLTAYENEIHTHNTAVQSKNTVTTYLTNEQLLLYFGLSENNYSGVPHTNSQRKYSAPHLIKCTPIHEESNLTFRSKPKCISSHSFLETDMSIKESSN